jgi:glycosyltransferase involved in cell wall biosynthesis
MKIVFFAPRFHTNQVEVINTLISNGYEVVFHSTYISLIENHDEIKPKILPKSKFNSIFNAFFSNKSNYFFISPIKYFRILKKENANLIIIRDPVSLTPLLAATIAKILSLKIIFYTQVNINNYKTRFQYFFYNSLIFFFKAKWYSPVFGIENSLVKRKISNLYYLPFPTKILRSSDMNVIDNKIKILSIGKFQKRKNQLLLLKAINLLKHQFKFQLTLIGECSNKDHLTVLESLKKYIELNNLSEIVIIHLNINPREIKHFYLNSNLYVLPSYNEPASISILEAMSYSIPVIVSDDCGNKDFVIDGITGFHFKRNSLYNLTLKIYEILNNKYLFNSMKTETEIHLSNNFSPSYFINNFRQILNSFE